MCCVVAGLFPPAVGAAAPGGLDVGGGGPAGSVCHGPAPGRPPAGHVPGRPRGGAAVHPPRRCHLHPPCR